MSNDIDNPNYRDSNVGEGMIESKREDQEYAGGYDAGFKAGLKGGMAITVERCLSIIDNAIACYDETEGAQRQALKICADHVRGLLPDHNYSERKLPHLRVDHEDVMFFRKI